MPCHLARLRMLPIAALLVASLLAGCEQEPATTIEGEQEPAVPGEPGAPEPVEGPDAEDLPDAED